MKTTVKIAIAAGGVLASMLAAAPAHAAAPAKAATPQLVGTCPETFICAWDPSGYLFWSVNASDNSTYYIDYNVSYVENLTGYNVVVDPEHSGYEYIPPHTGLTYIGDFVYKVSTNG